MATRRYSGVLAATAVLALGLLTSGCARTAEAPPAASSATTAATGASPTAQAAAGGDLMSLVPTPANTTTTKGPDAIQDNGIHRYFEVNGAPGDVMGTFKTALEGKGWQVSTLSSSSGGDGGGATMTGTRGDAYGVFDGGGYKSTTYIDVCLWPTKPANPDCRRDGGER